MGNSDILLNSEALETSLKESTPIMFFELSDEIDQ